MSKIAWPFCCIALPSASQAQEVALPQAMPTTIWFLLLMLVFVVILGIGFSVQLWRDAKEKEFDSLMSLPGEEPGRSVSPPSPRKR